MLFLIYVPLKLGKANINPRSMRLMSEGLSSDAKYERKKINSIQS